MAEAAKGMTTETERCAESTAGRKKFLTPPLDGVEDAPLREANDRTPLRNESDDAAKKASNLLTTN